MRLMKIGSLGQLGLTRDLIEDIPPYAILSHTWAMNEEEEASYNDLQNGFGQNKVGYAKIRFCGEEARKNSLQYFWVDTCCIDRANHTELSEAIVSMFRWYRNAAKCFVYLSDVSTRGNNRTEQGWESAFRKSKWFRRGWTLQELLAPKSVEFFSREGDRLGDRNSLEQEIHEITEIPIPALRGALLSDFSVDERMQWIDKRQTRRDEDMAYCLLGIFNVFMSPMYGEGENAFIRLKQEIERSSRSMLDSDMNPNANGATFNSGEMRHMVSKSPPHNISEGLTEWLSPVNPKLHHVRTSKSRADGSGTWFIDREVFKHWASSDGGAFFWLRGISGAGKTTLMSTIIDELLRRTNSETGVGYFYCSFDDKDSQLTENVFGSLLAQLTARSNQHSQELSLLYRERFAKKDRKPKPLPLEEMIDRILQYAQYQDKTFIAIDAVNEASEPFLVLENLKRLSQNCRVHVIMSSVSAPGFEQYLQTAPWLKTETIRMSDIQGDVDMHVRTFLETHYRMRGLPSNLKEEIVADLTNGNEGMFRWVQCQLVRLADLKTPGQIRRTLAGLPVTLDKTYEDILSRIDEGDRELAKEVLLLLTFCLRPMRLGEICEALQITTGLSQLDEDKLLLHPMDVVTVCGGLADYDEKTRIVSLAHHSVKTYLTSPNLKGSVAYFHLSEDEANQVIAEKCLTYLSFDAFESGPCPDGSLLRARLANFPFLRYAAFEWGLHARKLHHVGKSLSTAMKRLFLATYSGRENFLAWVQVLLPRQPVHRISGTTPLYYAASFGLTTAVEYLLDSGADIEAHGGRCGATPLGIASYRGYAGVVKILIERGADPYNPDHNPGWNAIEWASHFQHMDVLKILKSRPRRGVH